MSNNSIVSYLPSRDDDTSSNELSHRLSNALKQYQLDSDLQKLNKSYVKYVDLNKEKVEIKVGVRGVINAISTFNISPSHSYNRYMSVIKNKTDYEAIQSDWESVGEDISSVWIEHIISSRDNDE